jgi:hypothetical protein
LIICTTHGASIVDPKWVQDLTRTLAAYGCGSQENFG